jgi:hypothetical protein
LCTESCRLCVAPFGAGSGGITIQTCGNVGRATEGTIEHQRLPVARFGQGRVLLKARQVTKHGGGDGDIPGDPDGVCQGQGFFQECRGARQVTPHSCQPPKQGQGSAQEAAMLSHPSVRITFGKGDLRLIQLAVRLGDHPERHVGITDAALVADVLGQVQRFLRKGFCTTLYLAVSHHRSSYAVEHLDAEWKWGSVLSLLSRVEVQRQHALLSARVNVKRMVC